jgi:transposase
MIKPQLLQKVRQIKSQYTSYVVDNMAKDAGHTVLRLPPYYREFNPIELAWTMVKGYVKSNNMTFKIDDVRALLNTGIERVTNEDSSCHHTGRQNLAS